MSLFVTLLALVALPTARAADSESALIHEVEDLRASLPAQDPTRLTLTLRLGDLCFDEAGNLSRGHEMTPAEQVRAQALQKKSLQAYEEALSGGDGRFPAVGGNLKLKTEFQAARLYADLGQADRANAFWTILAAQEQLPELKREAILRLAEKAEGERLFAKSEALYQQAISLCNGSDLCSYAHYRRAWMLKDEGKLDEAIAEIQLGLFDSNGQVREEALRDFVAFLGEKPSDGKNETTLIEALSTRISRPGLLGDLAASFFAQGNRAAGTYVLALTDSRHPTLASKIRLMEENYGLKHWDEFRRLLEQAQALVGKDAADAESEKILKRLTVQLDGERTSRPQYAADFENTVELHLAAFPHHEDTAKMMQGWLAAETDPDTKLAKLKQWLSSPQFALPVAAQIELHEARAALAQKKKDDATLVEETGILATLSTDPAKRRQYRYDHARALYGLARYDECLPTFIDLAKLDNDHPDDLSVRSQNLALDIYAQKKDYDSIVRQAATWTTALGHLSDSTMRKEVADMALVAEKASFEKAAQSGESPASLQAFLGFCRDGKLLPQSCQNAKTLALKLKDEASLLAVLKILSASSADARTDWIAENEAAAYFTQAADELAKNSAPAKNPEELKATLKVALLYELGHRNDARDRVLRSLHKDLRSMSKYGEPEPLLILTFRDANLLAADDLTLHWSDDARARIAEALETTGKGDAKTHAALLASPRSTGPGWDAAVLAELNQLKAKQEKIAFYGARSRQKFAARVDGLKRVAEFGEKKLAGAEAATRLHILETLAQAHRELSAAILATPIPDAVQGVERQQVQEALTKLAEPFATKAKGYSDLVTQQAASTPDQVKVSQSAPTSVPPVATSATATPPPATAAAPAIITVVPGPPTSPDAAENALHANPSDIAALTALHDYYQSHKQERLAAYFTGRLESQRKAPVAPAVAPQKAEKNL